MNTLIFNVNTLAPTEHDLPCTGLHDQIVCTADGVYRYGGTELPGTPRVTMPLGLGDRARLRMPQAVYIHGEITAGLTATVETDKGDSYDYSAQLRANRAQRVVFGKGLRSPYAQLTLQAPAGDTFRLDRIDIDEAESARRIG